MSKIVLAWLACLTLATTATAAEKWTYSASDHFEVYTTAGDGQARDALAYFERVHAFFAQALRLAPQKRRPTRLVVFADRNQFKPYSPNAVAGAYYMPGPGSDTIVVGDRDENEYSVVVHEYAHLIMRDAGAAYPLWLNEGLAEFFSTISTKGGGMSIGKVPGGLLPQLGMGGLMPLGRLLDVTHDSPEYNSYSHVGIFYAQSWALTHMLMVNERYRDKADEFLTKMAGGASSRDVLMSVYGKTPEAIGEELGVYVRRPQWLVLLSNYRSPDDGTKPATRSVDEFEAGVVKADLLVGLGNRQKEAAAALDQLAAVKPDDARLLESRAMFELRSGRRDEAGKLFARAASIGSTNPFVYRMAADVDPSRRGELLARAVALAPDDLDMRLAYASDLVRGRQFGAAVAALSSAQSVTPDKAFDVFILLEMAYSSLDRVDEAKKAGERASQYATTQAQRDRAAQLAAALDRRPASPAAAQTSAAPPQPAAPASTAPSSTARRAGSTPLSNLKGRIVNVTCEGSAAILDVKGDGDPVRLVIDNPTSVIARGPKGFMEFEIACGVQDVPIEIGFVPQADAARKTTGSVRTMYFPEAK